MVFEVLQNGLFLERTNADRSATKPTSKTRLHKCYAVAFGGGARGPFSPAGRALCSWTFRVETDVELVMVVPKEEALAKCRELRAEVNNHTRLQRRHARAAVDLLAEAIRLEEASMQLELPLRPVGEAAGGAEKALELPFPSSETRRC